MIIKLELSKKSINDTINKLNILKESLKNIDKQIVSELCQIGIEEIKNNFAITPTSDGNEDSQIGYTIKDNKGEVFTRGTQVIYNEFGTGEIGLQHPHMYVSKFFSENPYNKGKTVRKNGIFDSQASANGIPLNGLYWTYRDKSGIKHYTQGIPAGMQVYKASVSLHKQKHSVAKKVVGDVLSKV